MKKMVVNLMKTNDIRELTTAEIETKVKALK
ncbi:50S ribosomal protein L29, partial [Klebsiella pneumoniae]